jgi:hypothetical protein
MHISMTTSMKTFLFYFQVVDLLNEEESTKEQTTIYNIIGPGWLNELGSSIT